MLTDTLASLVTRGPLSLSSATLRHLPLVREAISELSIDRVTSSHAGERCEPA